MQFDILGLFFLSEVRLVCFCINCPAIIRKNHLIDILQSIRRSHEANGNKCSDQDNHTS